MKLTYRGNAYEVFTSNQFRSDSTNQPKQKLIYRGQSYDYTPHPAVFSEAIAPNPSTVTLIYRGATYERSLQSPKFHQQSRAVNWRYRTAEEG